MKLLLVALGDTDRLQFSGLPQNRPEARARRQVEQFGVKQMRVLFVTESAECVGNMLSAVDQNTDGKGPNFFLFIDRKVLAAGDPLDVEWMSGKRTQLRLTD